MKKVLTKKIKQIPQKPGVYLFKDAGGRILYIGKARDILKRVKTHFSKSSNFFTGQFIEKISDIDWIKTENEKQALLLEDQLIKKYKPRYNIQWRDDKSYFWVNFTNDEWPRVVIVHKNKLNPPQSPFTKGGGKFIPVPLFSADTRIRTSARRSSKNSTRPAGRSTRLSRLAAGRTGICFRWP